MQSRIDLTWFISGNDHVNVCANNQSDWSTFVSDFGEELFLDLENAYWGLVQCLETHCGEPKGELDRSGMGYADQCVFSGLSKRGNGICGNGRLR